MIGIFLDCACLIASSSASVSKAARAIAFGFLLIALLSCSSCSAMAVSFCGPTKVILAPSSSAAFSAPLLTAFQKSCWKPLAITSTLKSPLADPPLSPSALLEDEQAVKANADAAAAAIIANLNDFLMIVAPFFIIFS